MQWQNWPTGKFFLLRSSGVNYLRWCQHNGRLHRCKVLYKKWRAKATIISRHYLEVARSSASVFRLDTFALDVRIEQDDPRQFHHFVTFVKSLAQRIGFALGQTWRHFEHFLNLLDNLRCKHPCKKRVQGARTHHCSYYDILIVDSSSKPNSYFYSTFLAHVVCHCCTISYKCGIFHR